MTQITIRCKTHNSPVTHAGDSLHWIAKTWEPGVYELDYGDLYCLGGVGEHDFEVAVTGPKLDGAAQMLSALIKLDRERQWTALVTVYNDAGGEEGDPMRLTGNQYRELVMGLPEGWTAEVDEDSYK